jgi:hypothetical protein
MMKTAPSIQATGLFCRATLVLSLSCWVMLLSRDVPKTWRRERRSYHLMPDPPDRSAR